MKKFLGITLSVCMLLSMTACGDSNAKIGESETKETTASAEDRVETTVDSDEKEKPTEAALDDEHEYPYVTKSLGLSAVVEVYKHSEDLSDWGSYDMFMSGDNKEWFYIKYPSLIPTSGNHVAYQNDGTVAAAMAADYESIGEKITDVESIVDLVTSENDNYLSVHEQMVDYFGFSYVRELNVSLEKKDFVTIGQFDCCRGEGSLTYTSRKFEGSRTLNFVIYGTFSENGHPFYWAVFDESEDQSLGDIVAQNAERMGYTIASELK